MGTRVSWLLAAVETATVASACHDRLKGPGIVAPSVPRWALTERGTATTVGFTGSEAFHEVERPEMGNPRWGAVADRIHVRRSAW